MKANAKKGLEAAKAEEQKVMVSFRTTPSWISPNVGQYRSKMLKDDELLITVDNLIEGRFVLNKETIIKI